MYRRWVWALHRYMRLDFYRQPWHVHIQTNTPSLATPVPTHNFI